MMFDSLNSKIMNLSDLRIGSRVNCPSCKSFLSLHNLIFFAVYQATHTQTDHSKGYRMIPFPKFSEAATITLVLMAR